MLTYHGGELWCPDHGMILGGEDGDGTLVDFQPPCFDKDGNWKPSVLLAMCHIALGTPTLPATMLYLPPQRPDPERSGHLETESEVFINLRAGCYDRDGLRPEIRLALLRLVNDGCPTLGLR